MQIRKQKQTNKKNIYIRRSGMGGGGCFERERIYVYIQLIHIAVQQKLKQHCKGIILQFKKKEKYIYED